MCAFGAWSLQPLHGCKLFRVSWRPNAQPALVSFTWHLFAPPQKDVYALITINYTIELHDVPATTIFFVTPLGIELRDYLTWRHGVIKH